MFAASFRVFVSLLAVMPLWASAAPAPDVTAPSVPAGFTLETVAHVSGPRELAVSPNGDLLIGSSGDTIYIIANALGRAAAPRTFATIPDTDAAGIALASDALYVGSTHAVWRIAYASGDRSASATPKKLATVRPGGNGGHRTTSVALAGDRLFASVGSSCNACEERDPTRATILEMGLDGSGMHPKATHIRNAIALAPGPRAGTLWAGVAGQDELTHGHPYEIFDDVAAHTGTPDYGWPTCYEDRKAVASQADCSAVSVPRVVFPAYSTPIGAVTYAAPRDAPYAFPQTYRNGMFVTLHGSWHQPPVAPRVVFVPFDGDVPATPVDWSDPSKQWRPFVDGFAHPGASRTGRPTGIAVARDGSLFVADDYADAIYRIRPERAGSAVSSTPTRR